MDVPLYIRLSVCVNVNLSVRMYACIYMCMSVFMYLCLFIYVCPSISPSICWCNCQSACMHVYTCVCQSVWLCVCMSICLSMCISICLYMFIYLGKLSRSPKSWKQYVNIVNPVDQTVYLQYCNLTAKHILRISA